MRIPSHGPWLQRLTSGVAALCPLSRRRSRFDALTPALSCVDAPYPRTASPDSAVLVGPAPASIKVGSVGPRRLAARAAMGTPREHQWQQRTPSRNSAEGGDQRPSPREPGHVEIILNARPLVHS